MNKVKGITVGTYLTKTVKNSKDKVLSSKEICNHCKMKDKCKYRQISKFENGKVIDNNVECDSFYFSITPKAIVTTGRDTITGRRTTKTFVGKNEKEAFNKALSFQIADAFALAISEEILFYNFANKPALRGRLVSFFTGRAQWQTAYCRCQPRSR